MFLGAGASKPLGFPDTSEILPKIQLGEEARSRYELFFPSCRYWNDGLESAVAAGWLAPERAAE